MIKIEMMHIRACLKVDSYDDGIQQRMSELLKAKHMEDLI